MNDFFKSMYLLVSTAIEMWEIILVLVIIVGILSLRNNTEGFTSYLRGKYRPHLRQIRFKYNGILDAYGPEFITTKLKRWNLY